MMLQLFDKFADDEFEMQATVAVAEKNGLGWCALKREVSASGI